MSDFKAKKFDFRPDPAWRAYSAPPDPLAVFKGPTSNGRERKEEQGKGKGREGRGGLHPQLRSLDPPVVVPYMTITFFVFGVGLSCKIC